MFYGKDKRMLPCELGNYDVIIAAPEGLSSQKTLQVWGCSHCLCSVSPHSSQGPQQP